MAIKKARAGVRLGSCIIDSIILGIIYIFLLLFIGRTAQTVIGIIIDFTYYTYFFGKGQTLGMKAMGIALIRVDGIDPVGYGTGLLRYLGMILSSVILCLGYLWILIDENNQGWHDKIAGTYVVYEDYEVYHNR